MKRLTTSILFWCAGTACGQPTKSRHSADVIVVGAGISGLCAALEAAKANATVVVIDMSSVFGGHAVMSEGGLSIVGSAFQKSRGIEDSIELALADYIRQGEDIDEKWARYYIERSNTDVGEWVKSLGVEFEKIIQPAGNSVPRFHNVKGRGVGLVSPIYRLCLDDKKIQFLWNTKVTALRRGPGGVEGVEAEDLRTKGRVSVYARSVILATGGFQSNVALLRKYWTGPERFPERMLIGSGINSIGLGHQLAEEAGASFSHLDYQWIYPYGIPDPRYPEGVRGMHARNTGALWLNKDGKRFVNELLNSKLAFRALLQQRGATYWSVFDSSTKKFFMGYGTGWGDTETVDRLILNDPKLTKTASTLDDLARATGLPAETFKKSIARYNGFVERGRDEDFFRFGPGSERFTGNTIMTYTPARKIENPPFYAVQFYPLSRKNCGGVHVDSSCRVLDGQERAIRGLFAVGELTGSAGLIGKGALEGQWLGPGILMGKIAGRTAASELGGAPTTGVDLLSSKKPVVSEQKSCVDCHNVGSLVTQNRPGYWHFEKVHRVVIERSKSCIECHAELVPNSAMPHAINRLAQSSVCASCHGQ